MALESSLVDFQKYLYELSQIHLHFGKNLSKKLSLTICVSISMRECYLRNQFINSSMAEAKYIIITKGIQRGYSVEEITR